MSGAGPVTEHITLLGVLEEQDLHRLLHFPAVTVTARHGLDARGHARVVLSLTHPDAEQVAQARQELLRECQRLRVRAFVV